MSNSNGVLKIAVVGLGPMGMHHVRAIKDLSGAVLTAVVDLVSTRAQETAQAFNCAALTRAEDLIGVADAVVIATPPEAHRDAAIPLMKAGIACLVEKPLAMSEQDCVEILSAAESAGVVAAVGHIERFNPATEALFAENLESGDIGSIRVKRFSPASGRQVPVDVVSDMMIHDLEILIALKGDNISSITARGQIEDWAHAQISFADGTTADVSTNRKADVRERVLSMETRRGIYDLDFMNRTLKRCGATGTQIIGVLEQDALRAEQRDFIKAIRTRTSPRVTPRSALRAMRVAWKILDIIGRTAS